MSVIEWVEAMTPAGEIRAGMQVNASGVWRTVSGVRNRSDNPACLGARPVVTVIYGPRNDRWLEWADVELWTRTPA